MIVHDVIQGSSEWLALRAGIPTASAFDQIITPKTGELSRSWERYMHHLLAERIMGRPATEFVSTWMDRGAASEAEAVAFYELERNLDTVKVGFVTNDAKTIGASPDRFVGDDGLLEIKVPKEATHVSYLLKKPVEQAYYPQVMGQLWITERKWLDVMSYHPEMPGALVRVERDEEYIAKLAKAVREFSAKLEAKAAECKARGWIRTPLQWPVAPQTDSDDITVLFAGDDEDDDDPLGEEQP